MRKNKLNHNREFMFGIMAMALVVLAVVIIFWLWCFPNGTGQSEPEDALPPALEEALRDSL